VTRDGMGITVNAFRGGQIELIIRDEDQTRASCGLSMRATFSIPEATKFLEAIRDGVQFANSQDVFRREI